MNKFNLVLLTSNIYVYIFSGCLLIKKKKKKTFVNLLSAKFPQMFYVFYKRSLLF